SSAVMAVIRGVFISALLACFLHVKSKTFVSNQSPWPSRGTVIETVFSNTERKLKDKQPMGVLDSTMIGASNGQRSAALTRNRRQLLIRVWRLPDPPPPSSPMLPDEPPSAPLAPYLPSTPPFPRPPRPPPRPQLKPPPPLLRRPPFAPSPSPPPPPTPPPPAPIPPKRPSPTAPPPARASPALPMQKAPPPRRPSPPPTPRSPPRPMMPLANGFVPNTEPEADFIGGNCSDIFSMITATNTYREWHQAPPLTWSTTIATEAQAYAEVLAAQQCDLEHGGVGGECLYGTEMYVIRMMLFLS
ncbi:hypothetical protein Vretifemale_16132, partial [Volvox reticuliferus]